VNSKPKAGFAASTEAGYVVAVDTSVSTELAAEGRAREMVHRIQSMRKSEGFDIADYIVTYYKGGTEVADVVDQFGDYIKQETLSGILIPGDPPADVHKEELHLGNIVVVLSVSRLGKQTLT
jgi:isoleucyl-tRNA synthetase